MKNIAVIGAGTMGNGIAHVFGLHGFKVTLVDISKESLQKALQTITQNLARQVNRGQITEENKRQCLSNIVVSDILEGAVVQSDLVIEAVSENPQVKSHIFKKLDDHCPENCILASNTSSISISSIATSTSRPDKVIGMHFMNPVPVMKLVEVIKGEKTSNETTQLIVNLCDKIQKVPVVVNDKPGFIANRILIPMINEAVFALQEGVAGVAEIDTIMKLGMAHPMGPLQLADLIGLDVCLYILNVLYEGFQDKKYYACPLLKEMVDAGEKGMKTGSGFYKYTSGPKELVVADRFLK